MSLGLLLIGESWFFLLSGEHKPIRSRRKTFLVGIEPYGVLHTVKHQKTLIGIQLNRLTSPLIQAEKYVSHSSAVHGEFEKFCIY
jgi:hypothetical protein